MPQNLLDDFGRHAKTIEICAETSAKTVPAFPTAIERGAQHATREIIEVERCAAPIPGEDLAVAGMGQSVLIQRAPENGDDRHGIVAALFRLCRPDMRAPNAAKHADFVAGVILPAKAANLGFAET